MAVDQMPLLSRMTTGNDYIYDTIDDTKQIRLLYPGKDLSDFRLEVVDLDAKPTYIALSYCWGGQISGSEIHCNGDKLLVTANVYEFLQYWQGVDDRLPLWIDAICINQMNHDEKTHQVKLMDKIYKQAHEACISIGAGSATTDIAMAYLPSLVRALRTIKAEKVADYVDCPLSDEMQAAWQGIADIYAHPWFNRIWTLQEATLPQSVTFRCGARHIPLQILLNLKTCYMASIMHYQRLYGVITVAEDTQETVFSIACQLISERRWCLHKGEDSLDNFLVFVHHSRSKLRADPRDKVYAMLGLAPQELTERLTIDYQMLPKDVSCHFAKTVIEMHNPFQILLMNRAQVNLEGGPSWCPDLGRTMPRDRAVIGRSYYTASTYFEASGDTKFSGPAFLGGSHTLLLKDFCIDEIVEVVTDDWNNPLRCPAREQIMASKRWLECEHKRFSLAQSAYGDMHQALCAHAHADVLTAGMFGYWIDTRGTGISSVYTTAHRHLMKVANGAAVLKDYMWYVNEEEDGIDPHMLGLIREFFSPAGDLCAERAYFRTRDNRIGIGAKSVQSGDRVVILHGGSTPFVLRRNEDPRFHTYMEEAYVHGIMRGEALDVRDELGLSDEVFSIP